MALRFNGNSPTGPNPWSAGVGRTIGTASGVNAYTGARALSARGGSRMAIHLTYGVAVGLPLGSTHPVSWALPSAAGVIASRNNITGAGGVTSSMQSGQNLGATLIGSGGVSSAVLGLIVSIAAALSGSGGVSSATTQALATLVATLTGSGGITATAAGLAQLLATLTGSGSVTANNTALMDITANIVGYGEATSQGIRDAVWSAAASEFNGAGTMGAKLNTASSGGVDLDALAAAVWAYATRTLTASDMPIEQQAQILDIWQRLGLDPANPMTTTTTAIEAGGGGGGRRATDNRKAGRWAADQERIHRQNQAMIAMIVALAEQEFA